MKVGVPSEIKPNEHRVGLTPTAVREYVTHGHEVLIQAGAGGGAGGMQLPPGISESGEVVDMAAWEAWQAEQDELSPQERQRREEVNINVHRAPEKDLEPGGYI